MYNNICEYLPNENPKLISSGIICNTIKTLLKDRNDKKLCVSLSGGVDSMVSLWALKNVAKDLEIMAIHINYNNRESCDLECEFLKQWCKTINIELIIYKFDLKRENFMKQNRNFYETFTKNCRFDEYRKLECAIIMGHNQNDCIENIITNISSQKHFNNLIGMKQTSIINDVEVLRPLLNIDKKDIKDFAIKYNIPFFQDSTPKWSRRGKIRDILLPVINSNEPGFINGLKKLVNLLEK
tara:strand:+ start:3843 stop:4562 length:720 start_codon:yes stop_codon:yes gene_type:complete